ncbi:hypothetical protein [Nitrosomonas communis]|uniref:hypothetical protein n=1 Tax=Nitrosomonas communis TaxID=44574 RepID=UPI003D268773
MATSLGLAYAEEQLELYREAERKLVSGLQSWTVDGREATRADLSEITKQIRYWERKVQEYSSMTRRRKSVSVSPGF